MKKRLFLSGLLLSIFVLSINAQCPNPVSCASGSNGDIVYIKLGGVGGTKTTATFDYQQGITLNALGSFTFNSNGTTRMSLTSAGYLGIGVTNPTVPLAVNGAISSTSLTTSGAITATGNISTSGTLNFNSNSFSSSSGMNGSIVSLNVNGVGGLKTVATFGYDAGITFNALGSLPNYTFNSNGTTRMTILSNGNVLIGKTSQINSSYILDVNGNVRANQVVVNTTGGDFVFDKNYNLRSLSEVEQYIKENNHLPEIQSAKEMQTNGVDINELQTKLLQKVEELTLYTIELKKEIDQLKATK
jgi:hypothetical protein